MIATTALFTEFFVIGSAGWLWLIPLITIFTGNEFIALHSWLIKASVVELGLLGLATYILGVFTESLSFGVEKLAIGATSNPRQWYKNKIPTITNFDWEAAQKIIWKSETAFKEFQYNRLRSNISRGIAVNSALAFLIVGGAMLFGTFYKYYIVFLSISFPLSIISPLSWWSAQVEYTARVRVAGTIAESENVTAG